MNCTMKLREAARTLALPEGVLAGMAVRVESPENEMTDLESTEHKTALAFLSPFDGETAATVLKEALSEARRALRIDSLSPAFTKAKAAATSSLAHRLRVKASTALGRALDAPDRSNDEEAWARIDVTILRVWREYVENLREMARAGVSSTKYAREIELHGREGGQTGV